MRHPLPVVAAALLITGPPLAAERPAAQHREDYERMDKLVRLAGIHVE